MGKHYTVAHAALLMSAEKENNSIGREGYQIVVNDYKITFLWISMYVEMFTVKPFMN